MKAYCEDSDLVVTQMPPTACRLRTFVNGVPSDGALDLTQPTDVVKRVPLAVVFASLDRLSGQGAFSPENVPVTVCAYDASRREVARCSLESSPSLTRSSRQHQEGMALTVRAWGGGRLVAAALQSPGEVHRWRFRLSEAITGVQDGPLVQVFLRISCDGAALPGEERQLAVVTWSHPAPQAPRNTTPVAKRPRILSPTSWGDVSTVAAITNKSRDSVFVCFVPRDNTWVRKAHTVCDPAPSRMMRPTALSSGWPPPLDRPCCAMPSTATRPRWLTCPCPF